MSDYFYVTNQVIIGEDGYDYRYVVTDCWLDAGSSGVTIEYQEKDENGVFKTLNSIGMGAEAAKLLIETLNKINVDR